MRALTLLLRTVLTTRVVFTHTHGNKESSRTEQKLMTILKGVFNDAAISRNFSITNSPPQTCEPSGEEDTSNFSNRFSDRSVVLMQPLRTDNKFSSKLTLREVN